MEKEWKPGKDKEHIGYTGGQYNYVWKLKLATLKNKN